MLLSDKLDYRNAIKLSFYRTEMDMRSFEEKWIWIMNWTLNKAN